MKIGADIQESMGVCSGKWLIEIPELEGMGRKDAASVKAMLSRQIDEARMAYGRYKTRILNIFRNQLMRGRYAPQTPLNPTPIR
jgi:predicted P-loop ATPase